MGDMDPVKHEMSNLIKDEARSLALSGLLGFGGVAGAAGVTFLSIAQGIIFAANSKVLKVAMPKTAFSYAVLRTAFASAIYTTSFFGLYLEESLACDREKRKFNPFLATVSSGLNAATFALMLSPFAGRVATSWITGVKLLGVDVAKLEGLHLVEVVGLSAIGLGIKKSG